MCRVWDIARGKCERVMEGHTGRLNSVRLGPNNTALTVSDDYTARVWDLSSGMCQHVLKGKLQAASNCCSQSQSNAPSSASADLCLMPASDQSAFALEHADET